MANRHSRVVWLEGMTLDPHHFQQWDRYQAHALSTRIQLLNPHCWGFSALEIDDDRLANGEFALKLASGVLPGGTEFDIPAGDPPPAPRSVSDVFEPTAARLGVYLCLPAVRDHGANCQLQGTETSSLTRYRARTLSVSDENTGSDERSIEIAEARFQLRFGTETLEGFSGLQIASIVRTPGGLFAQDESFIPTSLVIGASRRLSSLVSRLLELAVARSGSLSERKLASASQRQLTAADVTAMGLLSTLNAHIPLLMDAISGTESHPHDVYRLLSSLGGQLSAFVTDAAHPREFPVYDHSNPTRCYNELFEILLQMLGGAHPSANYRRLALRKTRENLYEVELGEEEREGAELILFASSPHIPEARLVSELPSMIRVASSNVIDDVLRTYTRALSVDHTSRLPAGVPEDPSASYFRIQRTGPYWEGIRESGVMAMFVPAEFRDLELRLVAVLRTSGA